MNMKATVTKVNEREEIIRYEREPHIADQQ
jgi:hypothetical protein